MTRPSRFYFPARQAGMSLVELMIAIAISMLLMAVITTVLVSAEGNKRTMTTTNDIDQTGDYTAFILDDWIRAAGSGFSPAASYTFGCPLYAKRAGTTVSPLASSAMPSPFGSVSGAFRLAPLIIAPDKTSPAISNAVTAGHTSDVLVIMSGADGGASILSLVTTQPTATTLTLNNTLGYNAGNIVLVADQPDSSANMAACVISQIATPTTGGSAYTSLALSTASTGYAAGTAYGTTYIAAMSTKAEVMNLGNFTNNNFPNFVMVGVGDNNTLYSYDILQTNGSTASVPLADGVFEMHAVYGVDSTSSGVIDTWASPSSGTYAYSALTAGTATAAELLQTIKAVRVGLILRSSLKEKTAPSTSNSISLFSDLTNSSGTALTYTRTFTGDELLYRYRKVELTIPIRNNRLL